MSGKQPQKLLKFMRPGRPQVYAKGDRPSDKPPHTPSLIDGRLTWNDAGDRVGEPCSGCGEYNAEGRPAVEGFPNCPYCGAKWEEFVEEADEDHSWECP